MNQTKSNICILIVSFALLFVAGCGSRFSMEQEEAQNVVDSIRKLDCLQEYTQYETGIINDENIYICFWGDCNLQDVFETTQCVNEYFQAHAESIILTEQIELRIIFFDHEPSKIDLEEMCYFASVSILPGSTCLDCLEIRTNHTIFASEFRNCPISYKWIYLTCMTELDDPEALMTISGLDGVSFVSHIGEEEKLRSVLQEVCYFDEHGIYPEFQIEFILPVDESLKGVYNEFVSAHADYRIFQDENGKVYLID